MPRKRKIAECHPERPHCAKGQCARCYYREKSKCWRLKNPEKAKLASRRHWRQKQTNKQCTQCGKAALADRTYCQLCLEKHRSVGLRARRELKMAVFVAYGGPICVCCGEKNAAFLTLDHVNNDGATHRRLSGSTTTFYQYLKRLNWPKEPSLQVMCANCNWGKRVNNGICPHQELQLNIC